MANYTSQYTFGVSADTKSAQSSLNALTKSLRDLQTKKITFSIDDSRINEAAEAAKILQHELTNAMNVKTGNLDLTKLNQGLQSAGTNVSQLGKALLSAGSDGQKAFSNLVHTIASAQAPVKQLSATLSTMGTTLMNTIKWQASSSLIHGLMSSISGAISYAKNLNSTLNDIRIVTGQSSDDMAKFAQAANHAAKELATSTNEFAKASLIYYQQGDSAELAAKKAAITTKTANVAFTASAQEMSEMLTAVWNSYQAGEDQLEHTVDVLAKLGATTASSMEEMATGMQKVAATANTVGVSMEQMSAIVATSASVTRQAPQTIGTAWNTILSRIGGLKLGETLEDGTDLNKYSKALQTIGVDILDASGNLREMGGVVDEIGEKWQNLNQAQKSALAQTIGGARQYTQILAFFENFDKYQANMRTAQNADGALQEQQEIYAESWEAASKRAQAAMETLYSQLINDKAMTQLTNFFSTLINLITNLTSSFGGAGNVISLLITQIVSSHLDTVATRLGESMANIKQLFSGSQEINEYAANLQNMRDTMAELSKEEGLTTASRIELQYDTQILEIKQKIAEQQGKLTKAQQETAQKTLENLEADKQYYIQIAEMQEKAQKAANDKTISKAADRIVYERARTMQGAEQRANKKEPTWNELGRADKAGWKASANELDFSKYTGQLANAERIAENLVDTYGRLEDKGKTLTVESLLHSAQGAKTELEAIEKIQQDISSTFAGDTWEVGMANGENQAADTYKMVQQQIENMAKSPMFDATQIDGFRTVLESIDYSKLISGTAESKTEIDALNKLLGDMQTAFKQAGQDGAADLQNIVRILSGFGVSEKTIKAVVDDIKGIVPATADVESEATKNLHSLTSKWETSLTKASTATKNFVTVAMSISRITTALNAVKNAYDTLSNPDVSGWQKFTTVMSTLVTVAYAAKAAMDLVGVANVKTIAKSIATTAAKFAESGAWATLTGAIHAAHLALTEFETKHPIGWILLLVGAIAALTAGVIALINSANAKWEKDMAERQKDLQEAMNKTSESTQKLQADLQNLQEIMSDTTLTYEEQLTKINEICNAYGIQATMLDVLSGNYDGLARSMKKAAEAQIDADYNAALANVDEANAIVDARTKRNGSAVTKTYNAGTGRSFWTGRINDQDEIDALMALKGSIEELGFKVSEYGITGTGDYDQLYKLISTNETLSPYVSKQGSYLNALNANLSAYGYSDVTAANSALRNVELQRNLIHSNNFDMFNTRNQDATIAEVQQLIKDSGAKTADERTTIANYLAGFSNYSNAGSQYQALNVLAGQAADVQLSVNASVENKEDLQQTILDQLLEDESIDVETLLKIKPTDIILDETTGKYTISEQARKLAEDQVKIEKAQTRQSLLDENKDLMTQDTFSKEDYTTLWETGLFETQEELQNYLHQSKETREQIWNNLYSAAVDAESEGLKQAIADAKERLPELEGELTQWYQALGEKSEDLVSRGIVSADDILGLSGEALYHQLDALRFKENQSIETNKGLLSQYDQVKNSTSDEDKNAFAKQLGLDKWDDTKVKEKIANIRAAIADSERIVSEFDEALSKGDSLVSAVADTKTTIAKNQDALESTDFYTKWTQQVEKATEASDEFAAAVGKQGTMTAESLAKLAAYDAEVYQKYTNMTSADWNEYVYANAMKYYDDLAKLYADDAAKMIEIQQQKKIATENYYAQIKALAQEAAEAEQTSMDEQIGKIETAYSNLSKADITTFSGIQKLKQSLMEVGYAAEEADRLIKNIGKDDDNATADELWAKANAEIGLLLQKQEIQDEKFGAAKYIVSEEHEGLVYLEDKNAQLKPVANGTGTYEIYTDEKGTSLIEPGTNRLVALTKATGEQAGYDIYVNKTGDAAYYLGEDGRLHDLAPAGVTSQGYTVYANQTGDGFIYIDPETKKVESLIAADNTDERYTIYADANGEGFFYVIKGTTQLKSLKAAGVTSSGYTIYANPTGDGYKYLNEEGKLIALEAAGATEAGYTVYATKDTEKDGWIYINESGETVSLKSIGKTETGYNVVADANGALWLFEPDGENSFKLRNLNSEDNKIIEHLMADDPENKFTFNNGIWTVNIDTTPVEKRVKVVVSYEDIRGEISEMNQGWMNEADKKHTYLQGTGFKSFFDDAGTVNAIGDYFGFEGKYGAANTHWLEDVQNNYGGDIIGWLEQNEIVPNSGNKRARNAYQLGGKELNSEVLAVWQKLLDNPNWSWENAQTSGGTFGDLWSYGTDTLLQETLKRAGITDTSNYDADYVQVRSSTGDYVSFQEYLDQQSSTNAAEWEVPVDIRYVVNAPEDAEDLIPMTKEEFLNSPAVKAATGMMSSWVAAGLDPNQMFKTKDQKFDFMNFLSNMFTIKDDGTLADGYNQAAYYCMQGFIKGLTGEEPEIQAILTAFGVNSLDTLRAAFGIQSPSKYTSEMGRYLVEGLEEGLNETEFSADTFGKRVLEEVKRQIGNITKEDMWDQFVPEKSQAGQVVTIGDKRNYLKNRGVQINSIRQGDKTLYQVWDNERALLEEMFDSEEAAIDAAGEALLAEDKIKEYIAGGFWNDSSLTNLQKAILEEITSKTLEKLGKGKTFDEFIQNGGTVDEFIAEWNTQYSKYLNDFESESDATWASILDTIEGVLNKIDAQDEKKAKSMLTRWQNIYEGIAAARKAAFEDENATYGGSMSKEQRDAVLTEKFLQGGFTGADAFSWLTSKVDTNSSEMQYRNYASRDLRSLGTAYTGFAHNEQGVPVIGNVFDYYTQLRTSSINQNTERLLAVGANGVSQAEAVSAGLEALMSSAEPIKTDDLVQMLMTKFPKIDRATAEGYVMQAFGIKDQMDANEAVHDKFTNLEDDENLPAAVADYLATQIADKNGTWDSEVAAELLQYVNGTLTEPLSAKAQEIIDQYAGDAVTAIEDFYQYLMDKAADIKAEYDARTEKREAETEVAQKAANGDYLTPAEQRAWSDIQTKYGSKNGIDAVMDIAQAQGADEAMTNWTVNQLNSGVDVSHNDDGSYDLTNIVTGAQEHYETIKELQDAYPLLTENSTYLEQAQASLADALGVTEEEFEDQRDSLLAASGETRSFNELTTAEKTALLTLTAQVVKVKNAWSDLTSNGKKYISTMSKAKENTNEYKDALRSLTKDVKTFFGGSTKVTDDWVKAHTKDIEKMVEGDEEALERLQDDLIDLELSDSTAKIGVEVEGADNVRDTIDMFEDMFKDLDDGAVVTPTMDTSGAVGALVDLMNQGGETAQQIEAALAAVGWEPEIEMEEAPLESYDQGNGTARIPKLEFIDGIPQQVGWDVVPITGEMKESGKISIPKIGSNGKGKITGLKKTGAGQSSGKTPSSGSGGGGGGGSKSAKKVEGPKRGVDEKERYHEITKKLSEQSSVLTRLDKIKSRTFGANHLKAINDEISALEKENELYAEQAAEASANMDANRARLEQYGATFNDDGTLNYDEYMDQIIEQYNAAVEAYNSSSQTAADELALKEAEEIYNEAKKAMEDYEEDMDKLNEAQENMLENQNKISAAMLEGIQYKVELKFDFNDRDIKMMQYFRDKWEELYDMQDESMRYMADEAIKYEDNLNTLGNAMNKLNAEYANGTLNESDYAAGLQDVNDKIVEQLNNLLTIKKSIKEAYGNTLQQATEELSKHTAVLDHSRSVMEQYIQLQQLMGLGADYSGLSRMYEVQYSSSVMNVKAAREYLDTLKNSKKEIEANIAIYGETDVLKQQLEDVNAAIQEGEDDLLSKTNQALTDAQNMFNNTMQAIVQTFDEQLFRMKNGLANLEDDYAYYQEEQARYLSTSKELYEVSKLNRQINDSIADATTKTSKERLKALQEYINAQADSTRLTEYDVQMMELQYKHALALQELEDARNAKSVVRLTRDENGNFGYQYTADDQNISDAQQKVEDALQQINELAANRVAEIEQAAIQAEREYRDSLLTIAADTTLTLEERQAKMEELTKRYAETMQFNQEQYNNASNALLTNQQYVYERYGVSIMSNTQTVQDQMKTSVGEMISQTTDYATFLQKQMSEGGAIYEALQTYKDNITTVNGVSGLHSWENMVASAADFEEANEAAADALSTINDTLETTLTNIADVTGEWEDHAAALDTVIANYEKLGQTAVDTLRKLAGNLDETEPTATSGAATDEEIESTEKQWMYSWGYGGYSGSWSGYDSRKAAIAGAKSDIYQKIMSTLEAGETDEETASNRSKLQAKIDAALKTIQVTKYKTGGLIDYTGPAWVDGSLSNPELMLNSDDTRNMLRTIQLVRDLDIETLTSLYEAINQTALGMMYSLSSIAAPSGSGVRDVLEQNVQITAEFPNATDRNEITAAFEDIVNLAAQYANRR